MDPENIDISNINLIKTKNTVNYKKTNDDSTYKKNYGIVNKNNTRISFEIKNIKAPFGIEKYNNQQILNIIINPTKNNEHHNLFITLKNLDDDFCKLDKIQNIAVSNKDILLDLQNKKYYSNLKKNNNDYIIRTHILGTPNIYTMINGKKFPVTTDDIDKKNLNIKIEFGTFWVTDENYGILLYAKDIMLVA
jgi:hypothetical protein